VQAVGWTPDGRKIVFRSSHEATFRPMTRLYTVSPSGGLPEALPMDRGILCSYSPDGSKLAYNRRGMEEYYWKRYKGGRYVDLWLYDFASRQYTQLSDYVGKSAYPMYAGGRLYFVSDRDAKGVSNLYTIDPATKKIEQVTRFDDFDIQWPSTDGQRIVFVRAGRLTVFDPATASARALDVDVPSDRWQLAERTINPRDAVQSFAVSNDGKAVAFEARGDVLLVPVDDKGQTKNLTGTTASRERYAQLSSDGSRVAFFSDKTGRYQLYVADAARKGSWEPLTTALDRTVYHLEWSPDGTKILFGNKDFALFYLDVATKKLTRFASSNQMKNDEFFWEVSDYSWSPDSKWITYSFVQFNRNNQVFLYSLEQNTSFPVTTDFYDSLNPSFDANGDYLYFLSYRNFDTRIDIFEDDHVIEHPVQVMALQLKAGQRPPYDRGKGRLDPEPFRIDLTGIESRVFPLPIAPGLYFHLKAGKGVVTYDSLPTYGEAETEELFKPGGDEKWTLHVFDMASQKDVASEAPIVDWRLPANREQMIVRRRHGAARRAGVTDLYGPARSGHRGRPCGRVPTGQDLRADRLRRRPRRAARAPGCERQGRRLPGRDRRPRARGRREPLPVPAGGARPEGVDLGEREADDRRRADVRGRAAPLRGGASLQPVALRQHRHGAQGIERRGVPRGFQGEEAGHGDWRAVVGRPGRHPQPAVDRRWRHGGTVEQRLLQRSGQVAHRRPRRRPGHRRGQRPGVGLGRPRRPARARYRRGAAADQGEAVHLPAGADVSDQVGARLRAQGSGTLPAAPEP
jgi:tricorn protease-like protein